jgi:hypothetical protein
VDDLFVSPVELPMSFLAPVLRKTLDEPANFAVGGVFLLSPVSYGESIEYRKRFFANARAVHPLPAAVSAGLIAGNDDPEGPRWQRE